MGNPHRGEITAVLDGKSFTLCLTLGALAELEHAFGSSDIATLAQRFESGRLSANDLIIIIGCGLRGAGHALDNAEVAALRVSDGLPGYVRIAAELLAAAFGQRETGADNSAIPPAPQDA